MEEPSKKEFSGNFGILEQSEKNQGIPKQFFFFFFNEYTRNNNKKVRINKFYSL